MNAWSDLEVELIVADYFDMLVKELSGKSYVKADHRRKLLPLLNARTEGSIEFKYQNISAVLVRQGQLNINGYLPRYNYQKILEEKVIDYLETHPTLEKLFNHFAEQTPIQLKINVFDNILVEPPNSQFVAEPAAAYTRNPIKTNYLEKEQQNRSMGVLGEEFVLEYEKWQLTISGKENLADQVRWIAKEDGDGAGFDILSRNMNGTDKYIEVKTTRQGKETPFFFTRNEMLFSQHKSKDYHLYRLFDFEKKARMFVKKGNLDEICTSVPMTFKGYF